MGARGVESGVESECVFSFIPSLGSYLKIPDQHWVDLSQIMSPTKLNIAHFNDVYQVSEQPVLIDGKTEKIDVTKFATSLDSITSKWEKRSDGHKDGLIIFSGDLFSPSIESSTTRGGHMVNIPVFDHTSCLGG